MVEYKSKPNYILSAAGKMVKFNSLGSVYVNKPEVMAVLDKLPNVKKVMPKSEPKVEAPKPKAKKKK